MGTHPRAPEPTSHEDRCGPNVREACSIPAYEAAYPEPVWDMAKSEHVKILCLPRSGEAAEPGPDHGRLPKASEVDGR